MSGRAGRVGKGDIFNEALREADATHFDRRLLNGNGGSHGPAREAP